MKLSLRVTRHTTASELVHLGNFFTALGLNRGAAVFAAPTDPAELHEGDVTFIHPTQAPDLRTGEVGTIDAGINVVETTPAGAVLKRRRRTKAEIEAEAVANAEAAAQASNEAGLKAIEAAAGVHAGSAIPSHEGEAGNDQAAPTQTAPVTDTASATQEPAAPVPATASPSEPTGPVTHAEAQKQAIDAARRHGPEKVKAVIGQYEGASKIADLNEADLAGFVAKLQALAA